MDCQISRSDDVAEVVLIGRLDSSWSPYLSDRLDEVVRTGAHEVRVDMSAVSYLSSNGIALLIRYHRQMRQIGGRFRIVADSEAVSEVLRLTGVAKLLRDEGTAPAGTAPAAPAPPSAVTIDLDGMTLQVFKKPGSDTAGRTRLDLIGDAARFPHRGYGAEDERTWRAVPGGVALGLGALGPDFEACRDRFGEFLAASGVAAYRPSDGPGRPDFEQAAGAFVPEVRVLYGLAFPVSAEATLVRFEAKGDPGQASTPLSRLAAACLDQAGASTAGLVLVGETNGLVGTALRRSPVTLPDGVDPFAHPQARDWLSLTSEPEHARSTALVVGVATRAAGSVLAPFVRPLLGGAAGSDSGLPGLQGHFHAAVVPYRPLPRGAIEFAPTVQLLFEPGRVETVLHLLGDSRPILGAGESTFSRGVVWVVPLTDEGGMG
jgi:anti-anti-sigma factor